MSAVLKADPYREGLKLSAAGRHLEAIEQFERALGRHPDDSRVLFALGNTARHLGMAKPAEDFFRRVLALEPHRLEALVSLANLLRSSGQLESAEALLAPALARAPEAPELWLTLGSVYREQGDSARAGEHYRQALARRPNYPQALGNLADLLADDGDVPGALALYDRVVASEPDNAQARLNRAILHLLRGDLKAGWRDYAARLKVPGKVPLADHKLARWTGGPVRRLLVTAEQGIGDQIMFASLVPDLARRAAAQNGKLFLECEPRLVSLFARAFPTVAVRSWDVETRAGITRSRHGWLRGAGGANAAVEMGTLPRYLRPDLQAFAAPHAYLASDPEEKARWGAAFAGMPKPHIGICWRSGNKAGHRQLQYAPLKSWAAFIRDAPGTVVCVQYGATREEIAQLESLSGRKLVVPEGIDQKNELDRAAALLSALDAVVSAPTAVSWLAAACGVPTCKILYDTSWTSFGQSFEPFAPSCRCMMPATRGDWAEVFAQTRSALHTL